jgi:hypothetical protein
MKTFELEKSEFTELNNLEITQINGGDALYSQDRSDAMLTKQEYLGGFIIGFFSALFA